MMDIENLVNKSTRLLGMETPPISELRRLSVEVDDLVNSADFQGLDEASRNQVQKILQDLRSRIRGGTQSATVPMPTSMPVMGEINPSTPVNKPRPEERQHNPYAQESMEEAEKLFYSGRYNEAIKIYDQVLNIEPDWERARQHRSEAEGYLRSGHIPAVALPAEAATAFSKAQSAARLGRYQDAMGMLMRAQNILQQFGIQRWQEGQEFEQKLQQNIDAENVYNEGLQLFSQGQIEEGIDKVDSAAQVTGLPRYADRLQTLLKERDIIDKASEVLNVSPLDPKAVTQAKTALDGLILKYGQNPTLQRLKTQIDAAIPRVMEPIFEQVQGLKTQAVRAQTIEAARNRARQARQLIDQAKSLDYSNETLIQYQADIEKLLQDLQRYEDQLDQARIIVEANRSWPAAAVRMSSELRTRYPNDPGVLELNKSLSPYNNVINGIKIAGMVLVAALLVLIFWLGYLQINSYVLSLTPTSTATATATGTATATPRPTATFTPTPRPTGTATITPTPQTAIVARKIWARDGCYEDYTAIAQIPEGGVVHLLPAGRRFDALSRECLLVEYVGEKRTTIGWILIADLK